MGDTRIDALSIQLQSGESADKLAEEYGKVIAYNKCKIKK